MPVVSVKVKEETKKEMEKYRKQIDWPGEIRKFIGGKIEEVQRQNTLEEVEKMLGKLAPLARGTSARLVREDRDSSH